MDTGFRFELGWGVILQGGVRRVDTRGGKEVQWKSEKLISIQKNQGRRHGADGGMGVYR